VTATRSFISGGRVYCKTRQAHIEVAECLSCAQLRELHDEASPPYLICDADAPLALFGEDPAFLEWWFRHRGRAR
jgi:hypothetical protein